MDHARAIELEAVERYLLKELSAAEAEEFERHYFECAECAAGVDAGMEFVENAGSILSEPPTGSAEPAGMPEPRKSRRRWWQDFSDAGA